MNAFKISFVLSGLSSVLGFTSFENMSKVVMVVRVIMVCIVGKGKLGPTVYDVIVSFL